MKTFNFTKLNHGKIKDSVWEKVDDTAVKLDEK